MQNQFFKGLKVVEFASVLAGPAVGMFFAELGAEVKERSAAGHSKFTVSLFCGCDGNFNGMTNMSVSRMRNAGQPFLLDLV